MTQILHSRLKTSLFAAAAVLALLFALEGALPAPAEAQAARRDVQPGQPGYQYRVLTEKDFQLYLELAKASKAGESPADFAKKSSTSLEELSEISTKISVNAMARESGYKEQLVRSYGQSIIFNDSENKLFEKYDPQIRALAE
jgi:hypothetical protein